MKKRSHFSDLVIIRGGGDLATGVAVRLYNCGFDILILEAEKPTFIRRTVSLGLAVYQGEAVVEGVTARLAKDFDKPAKGFIPVLKDPDMKILDKIQPLALVDALIAKKNIGLTKDLCGIVIALGPGFQAGVDCHAVIETMRGHNLGRVLYSGCALADTKTPGIISGIGAERVIHAHASGKLRIIKDIGETVKKGEPIAHIDGHTVEASVDGIVRGMIMDGMEVFAGMKIADIDPRKDEVRNCLTISDKSRALGGSVLEAIMHLSGRKNDRS
jgi:xanthine dehydrogenase accessory factor